MPLAIDKWKLNTSLEAKLNLRPIALRNVQERSKFKIQEALTRAFRDFLYEQGFTEIHTPKIGQEEPRVVQTFSNSAISTNRLSLHRARSFTNR